MAVTFAFTLASAGCWLIVQPLSVPSRSVVNSIVGRRLAEERHVLASLRPSACHDCLAPCASRMVVQSKLLLNLARPFRGHDVKPPNLSLSPRNRPSEGTS